MTIAIFIRRFDFGGAENYTRELANALAQNGHNVFVFAPQGRQRRLLSPNVKFRALFFTKWLLPFNVIYLLVQLKALNVEIIHAQQPSAIRVGSVISAITGIPLIVTIHSTTPLELASEFTRNTPARIIYVSRFTMERSDWFSTLRPKCRYIPNGIIPRDDAKPKENGRLVYCSRIDKSHANLLKLLINDVMPQLKLKIPNITLEIIGDGDWFRRVATWVQSVNNSLGATTIQLNGFSDQFLSNGALVIGVGRVALEALSSGIPVLAVNATRCGPRISSANYDTLSRNNFVDVTAPKPNAETIIGLIVEAFTNYQNIIADSQCVRERANIDFCLSTIVDQIQNEYQNVVDEQRINALQPALHNKPASRHFS